MEQSVSLFLMRAAGMLMAGMLLFAVFAPAHAQTQTPTGDNYGLKRFDGDNYDIIPPGAGIPAPPSLRGYVQAPGQAFRRTVIIRHSVAPRRSRRDHRR